MEVSLNGLSSSWVGGKRELQEGLVRASRRHAFPVLDPVTGGHLIGMELNCPSEATSGAVGTGWNGSGDVLTA